MKITLLYTTHLHLNFYNVLNFIIHTKNITFNRLKPVQTPTLPS